MGLDVAGRDGANTLSCIASVDPYDYTLLLALEEVGFSSS